LCAEFFKPTSIPFDIEVCGLERLSELEEEPITLKVIHRETETFTLTKEEILALFVLDSPQCPITSYSIV
jgi:hypothetical protein